MATKRIMVGDVEMPLDDFVVARTGILGITRSGKTYAAKGIAEQLLDAGVPIVVFDAIGVWRFLKTPGVWPRGKGYQIVVAGGAKPDLPLTPESAPAIVRAAIHANVPLVLDLYDRTLSKADWRRIVEACFTTLLYENEGRRHVFLEEASEFAPQKVGHTDGRTYAAVEKLARMAGNVGIGITFINQRSQELNKAVLELCDNLVLHRQRGSHAISALEKWMGQTSPTMAKRIATSLPNLEPGQCWVWTEDRADPIQTRTHALRSLHPDRRHAMPSGSVLLESVDAREFVERLSGELTTLLEQAKANDPAELRKRIKDLERDLAMARAATPASAPAQRVEVPVLTDDERAQLVRVMAALDGVDAAGFLARVQHAVNELHAGAVAVSVALQRVGSMTAVPRPASVADIRSVGGTSPAVPPVRARGPAPGAPGVAPDEPQRRILSVCLMLEERGIANPDRECVARWIGIHPNGGRFGTNLGWLRAHGMLEGLALTSRGRAWAAPMDGGVDGAMAPLDEPQRSLLRAIMAHGPASREEIAAKLGIHPHGGRYGTNLGRLRTMRLIPPRGELAVLPALYAG